MKPLPVSLLTAAFAGSLFTTQNPPPSASSAATAAPPAPIQVQARRMGGSGANKHWDEWKTYPVTTVADLHLAGPPIPLDKYGGRADKHGETTGFYHTQKIDGRWWLVDPAGNLFLSDGIDSVEPGASPNTRAALTARFGNERDWIAATQQQLLDNGNNSVGAWSNVDLITGSPLQRDHPLAYAVNLDIMSAYGTHHGGTTIAPGHKAYPENTIFVFDPEFESFARSYVEKKIRNPSDPNLLGYFSDNEIPLLLANLDGFLSLPATDPGHRAAALWLASQNATAPTDELRAAFLEYEAGRYFQIVSSAIRRVDPHHMYLGCRFYGAQLHQPEMFRAIAPYADAVSINVYNVWQPGPESTAMWEHESGKPFLVTEFYTKAEDSGMANTTGAGWLVHTQNDRGLFYQNFAIALLRSRTCVGWHWFKYQDNDPADPRADPSNLDSNKGIVNSRYQPYDALLVKMRELNQNLYRIADLTAAP